ncbi:MAG: SDR family oxidoreductase [Opitutae bacterium]|nr:SDR family oxidoreductase [Opitutae bacterium]
MRPKNNPRSSASSAGKSGPVALVTGASQGIGAAIAKTFAAELRGVRLALVARNGKKLAAVARACAKLGATAEIFPCDVTDEAAVDALARAVTQRFGHVDVLINNAGVFAGAPFAETTVAQFDRVVAASLRSTFLVSQAFVPGMVRRRRGDVFNMSSIAGRQAYPGGAAYCAAKFGVTGLTQVMRAELKDKGVRVCGVFPGATWTPSWEQSGFKAERMMPAEDIARAILDVYRLSRRTVVEEIVLRPQLGDV